MGKVTKRRTTGHVFLASVLTLILLVSQTGLIFAAETAASQPDESNLFAAEPAASQPAESNQETGADPAHNTNSDENAAKKDSIKEDSIKEDSIQADDSKAAAIKAYREFADGSRTAAYSQENIEYRYFLSSDLFRDNTSYSLQDLVRIYQAAADEINAGNPQGTEPAVLTNVEYKILEEGPYPVMALQLTGDRFLPSDDTKMLYILYYDGKSDVLRFVFGKDSWSRRDVKINNAGVVTVCGSNSAFEDSFTYYMVDGSGVVQHLYTVEFSNQLAATAPDLEDGQRSTWLCSYYLSAYPYSSEENNPAGPEYSTLHKNVSYRCDSTFAIESVGQLDSTDPLYMLYTEDGTLLVNNAVVAQAILRRMDSLGIPAESFFADAPSWETSAGKTEKAVTEAGAGETEKAAAEAGAGETETAAPEMGAGDGDVTDDPAADEQNELKEYFLGEHERTDDGSTLSITENGDGTFRVAITIFRLCNLENGTGTFKNHVMTFNVEDPSGENMTGRIYRNSDNSLIIEITESTWGYLPAGERLEGFVSKAP